MAGQFTSTNRIVAMKEETSPGVFEVMSAADYNIEFLDADTLNFDMNAARAGKVASGNMAEGQSFSTSKQMPGYSVTTLLRNDNNPTVIPNIDPLLRAAGLKLSTDAITGNVIYTFDGTQPCETVSVEVTELNCGANPDAITSKARGCVPNMTMTADGIGQQNKISFDLMGAYESEADNADPIKTLSDVEEGFTEKLLNSTFTIGDTVFILHSYTLDMGNNTVVVPDPSKPGAVFQGKVVGADPVLTAEVQMIDLGTSGLDDAVTLDTVFDNITIVGNGWDIEITEGNIRSADKGDADSIMTQTLEIEVRAFRLVKKDLVS